MQTSLLKFFSKTPKGEKGAAAAGGTLSPRPADNQRIHRFPPGSLVWAKLSGYPWWPSVVCSAPGKKSPYRKDEIHVQFFDTPVTRAWISESLVRDWADKVAPGQATDHKWEKGVKDAEAVAGLSCSDRLDVVLLQEMPSDDEWNEEVSPGSKENKPDAGAGPARKRRRIILMDSDDSGDDATFQPKKEDLEDEDEDDEGSDGEPEDSSGDGSDDQGDASPLKSGGNKRKRNGGSRHASKKNAKTSVAKPVTPLSTPVNKFKKSKIEGSPVTPGLANCSPSIFAARPVSNPSGVLGASSPLAIVTESTKKKLSKFGAPADSADPEEVGDGSKVYPHTTMAFLKPDKIRDKEGRRPEDPDYNPRTLLVPEAFLRDQRPAQQQWWKIKSDYYDVILFFKTGKFYEIFHMDADIAVAELNLIYMKDSIAHAGFPETAYWRYASTLVEKGYKVARIEQTETEAMKTERIKSQSKTSDKSAQVVKRELCQLSSKGTKVNNFFSSETYEGEPRYLVSVCESSGTAPRFGVAFVDTTIGMFSLGQFTDDKNLSRLRTLMAHHPPAEVLQERGGLSSTTASFLAASLPGVRREVLRPSAEFWDAAKTLKFLAEGDYFREEAGGKLE